MPRWYGTGNSLRSASRCREGVLLLGRVCPAREASEARHEADCSEIDVSQKDTVVRVSARDKKAGDKTGWDRSRCSGLVAGGDKRICDGRRRYGGGGHETGSRRLG